LSCFPFSHRLHHPWEYRCFFKKNEVFRLPFCYIYRIPNEVNHYRLGITLKARGSSVERNQVKRQIREFFRNHAELLGSFDYNVVIPKMRNMAFPFAKELALGLRKDFSTLLP
jgi:ribonuclease P protein component